MGNAVPELEWKAAAIADLMAIVDWISDDSPAAALALMEEIEGKVVQLPLTQDAAGPAGLRAPGN